MARAGLSRDEVVRIALRQVDEGGPTGFDDLSLARVASAAGVATPSLYKHIASLARLRQAVSLGCTREFAAVCAAASIGRSEADALRSLAIAMRDFARAHPGRYAAVQAGPDPDDPEQAELRAEAARVVGVIAAVLQGFGLPESSAIDAVRAARSALHGFVSIELAGGFRLPDDLDRSFDMLVELLVEGFRGLASSPARGPSASSIPSRP
ncbi:TetR/AcrR family transcriptional regulator [Agromyces sp. Soil535]|uniref:TetR/AcrR family transcriptional regulator n=1 Tax=Agromyces sp. Soil535 TaxID=1736390 RepID=UPI0006F5A236|nr:TetR-like C-terminal domain-containing protein [Agromyces sp. Soil535]KRE21124.1 transcriptional regulator [Agromyces sp. Soil535]